ncbi:MAG: hypothetical protein WC551_14255 [Patescibacteria group bacterium]
MMHKMMISEDCGINYYEAARSENPEDFAAKIQECERDMLRWVIEDERGDITHASSIHLGIMHALHTANKEVDRDE